MIVVHLREVMDAYRSRTGTRMTYQVLAERTGVSRATIQSLATRRGYNGSLSTIAKLCEALDCDLADMLALERVKKVSGKRK